MLTEQSNPNFQKFQKSFEDSIQGLVLIYLILKATLFNEQLIH